MLSHCLAMIHKKLWFFFRGLPCNIYYVPDEEIDLEEYLEKPLPKIPLKPYIQSHWLAIEGVQPPIQQNPVFNRKAYD